MRIQGFDHVEFYVGDLAAAVAEYSGAFGLGIAGRENPAVAAQQRSVLLQQGGIRLVLTCAVTPGHPAAGYVDRHGDGPAVIAFRTDDVEAAFAEVVARGARPVAPPEFATAGDSTVGTALVSGFGDTVHRLVQRTGPGRAFAPGLIDPVPLTGPPEARLEALDHVAVCVPGGELDSTIGYYRDVFGLSQIFEERIEVGGQAMLSKVVQDSGGTVTFTMMEPDRSREPGQLDDFLTAHGGAGVQHLAFRTPDIADAIHALSGRGVEFLDAPAGYYQRLETRLGALAIPVPTLRELNVLADLDRWGQMFQIFARSSHERHTFFVELIERQGALTFGTRNILALYEALEFDHSENSQLTS